jgi:methyl-accepting chemotaxis protein
MLTYLLASVVALASIGLYAMTFFVPAFKKEQDLIWSGVGLFYALVLWICAGQVRGGLLLGQMASVAIIGWLGWQAFGSRWAGLSESDKAQAKVLTDIKAKFDSVDLGKLGDQAKGLADKAKSSAQSVADKTKEVAGDTKGLVDKAKDAAQTVADKTKEVASDSKGLVDKAKDAAQTVAEKTKEVTANPQGLVDKAKDAVVDTKTTIVDQVEKVADKAVDQAEKVADKVADAAPKPTVDVKKAFTDAAAEAQEAVVDTTTEVVEAVTEKVEEVAEAAQDGLDKA